MANRILGALNLSALSVAVIFFVTACGDGDTGLSRAEVEETVRAETAESPTTEAVEPRLTTAEVDSAIQEGIADLLRSEPRLSENEVEEIVRAEMAEAATPTQPGSWLTIADVEGAIRAEMADMPEPDSGLSKREVEEIVNAAVAASAETQPGLTVAEAEQIARGVVASIPPKSAPAEYTKYFVNNAISLYETQGLEATLAYYNREESVDGQWYVFIIDENNLVIGYPDSHRIGLDLKGWVSLDATGKNFGPDMPLATEDGKWVSYVYLNPESGGIGDDHTGALEYKHVWVVRHDDLLFASGWHISADEYTKFVVDEAIARYHADGLEATLAYYNNPDSVDAQWYVFIATPGGDVLGHYNTGDLGSNLEEMLDEGSFQATEGGIWLTHTDVNPVNREVEDKHFWLVKHDGLVFGSGWHHDESG